uniref:Reverse transcriptase Ty1/copia-type domain-containing protein n=1 Tax=Fagus sylvatica TaxID=28930 RepID=A0A2N9I8J5_FAGSY
MLSPAPLLSEIRSSRCQEADSSPKGPTAALGSAVLGLRSRHRRYRWKDLKPKRQRPLLCHVSRLQDATSALIHVSPRQLLPRQHSATIAYYRCNMRAGILQRSAALTASKSVPSSDAASFDPVSLTTPTYSIADLQALFSQVQALFCCCNHMTDNPHLTSAHTPPVLPTITTADGSAMTVSHVGSISTPNLSISDVFCVPKLHLNLLSVGQLTELGLNLFFSSRGCLVQDSRTGQIVGSARKVGRLFELTSLHFPSSSVSAPVIAASASIELWHSRLVLTIYRDFAKMVQTQYSKAIKGEAALTAVYTINRCPSPIIQNTTPYERLFGTAPNYSLLKVFGCVCFVLLQPHERTKLQPRSQLCCFLGYGLEEKGYRCYDPVAKRLRVSRHVVFWEHKMFYSLPLFSAADPTFDESPLTAPAANPVNTTAPEPRRSHRASSDPLWQQAMKEELDALLKTGTWDLVDLPAGKSAIGCKWVYKIKTRSDGTVDRYKARLVAKGFTQEYGIDYEETFAPVARLSSLPPGFSQPPGFSPKVCRLCRALYGLKQAPRAWFAKFSSTISQHGFSASSYDSALFFRRSDHGITLLLLYVDDMIITGDDVQGIQDLKRFLGQHFEMKDLGPLSYFLGLEVSSSSDGYYLTQAKYTSDLISRAGITDSKIVDTPIEYNNRLNTHDGEPLPDATLTDTVLRILRYLKGTLFHGLHFSSQSSLTLQAYSDADWAGDPTDRRSTTGYCFLLGDSLISWRSKKQSVVARSSTEAEYRALADTTAELLWLRWLLQDLGIDCSTAGTLQLRSVSSQDQLADIFTKPMPPGRFRDLISKLKLVSVHPT